MTIIYRSTFIHSIYHHVIYWAKKIDCHNVLDESFFHDNWKIKEQDIIVII